MVFISNKYVIDDDVLEIDRDEEEIDSGLHKDLSIRRLLSLLVFLSLFTWSLKFPLFSAIHFTSSFLPFLWVYGRMFRPSHTVYLRLRKVVLLFVFGEMDVVD